MALLLDTSALIFLAIDEIEASKAKAEVQRAYEANESIYISPISAWEIGLLVSRGRLNLTLPPEKWFAQLLRVSRVLLAEMTPTVLIASSFLPDAPLRDPADRIIVATAREFDLTILTSDRAMLAYSDKGHVRALAC